MPDAFARRRNRKAVAPELLDAHDPAASSIVALRARPSVAVRVGAAFEQFLEHCERENAEVATLRAYRQTLRKLEAYLVGERGRDDIWNVTPADLDEWVLTLMRTPSQKTGKPLSAYSVQRYVRETLACFHWLEASSIVAPRASAHLHLPRIPVSETKQPQTFTDAQVDALFAAAGAQGQGDNERIALTHRNRALLSVLLDAGPRVSELLSMRVEHIDLERASLRITHSKTRVREVGVGFTTMEHLRRYLTRGRLVLIRDPQTGAYWDQDVTDVHGPLFVGRDGYPLRPIGVDKLFARLRVAAGFAEDVICTPHHCRRYAITRALQGDASAGRAGLDIMAAARHFGTSPEVIWKHYYAGIAEETLRAARTASPLDRLARERARTLRPQGGRRASRLSVDVLEE